MDTKYNKEISVIYSSIKYFIIIIIIDLMFYSPLLHNIERFYYYKYFELCFIAINYIFVGYLVFLLRSFGITVQWGVFCLFTFILFVLGSIVSFILKEDELGQFSIVFFYICSPLFWLYQIIIFIYNKISNTNYLNKKIKINKSINKYILIGSLLITSLFIMILIGGVIVSAEDYD
jgi:hypothetical protein